MTMMKNKITILLIIFFQSFVSLAQVPDWAWAKSIGGNQSDYSHDITCDIQGNAIITGDFFSTTLTLGAITLNNSGTSSSIFIAKYDSAGNILWAKCAGGIGTSQSLSITSDNIGNSYITGYFFGDTIYFGNIALTNISNSYADIFITKYDASGNEIWAKSIGSKSMDCGKGISVDGNCNIYITGYSNDTITFGLDTLTGQGFFLAKYDSSGNILWAKHSSGNCNDIGVSVKPQGNNYVYLTGNFDYGILRFDSTIYLENTNSCIDGCRTDIFVAKYDSNGNFLWARKIGGDEIDMVNDITVDIYENLYVAGDFCSPVLNFDSNYLINTNIYGCPQFCSDLFIAKYDSAGNVKWLKNADGFNSDHISSVITDKDANVYTTGNFVSASLAFDSIILSNSSIGWEEIFIAKFDSTGNTLWAKQVGGSKTDCGAGIAIDSNNNIYTTGEFTSPSISFGSTTLIDTSNNLSEIYIAKLGSDSTVDINHLLSDRKDNLMLFPNPTKNCFTVIIPPATRQIQISNSLGQVVQRKIIDRETKIDFRLEYSGIYFLQVMTDSKIVTKKLIVTN
jgi:hypothetical protein